jgi:diacylglycerol kinase
MSRFHSTAKSFGYAFEGIRTAFRQEPNFQIHVVIAILVIVFGTFLGLTPSEWLLLLYAIFLVLILELFNTSIEAIINLISPDIHPKAKIAKDISAAAVLLAAIQAVIIGGVIFIGKLL